MRKENVPNSYTDEERAHALKTKCSDCNAPNGIGCVTVVWEFCEPYIEDRPQGPHHSRIKKALKFVPQGESEKETYEY